MVTTTARQAEALLADADCFRKEIDRTANADEQIAFEWILKHMRWNFARSNYDGVRLTHGQSFIRLRNEILERNAKRKQTILF